MNMRTQQLFGILFAALGFILFAVCTVFRFIPRTVRAVNNLRAMRNSVCLAAAFCALFVCAPAHSQTVITTTITTTTNASGGITTTTNTVVSTNGVAAQSSGLSWSSVLAVGQQVFGDLKGATNWAVVPYGSYGLKNHKIGGGILALYDFNNYIGSGIGLDEMGSLSVVSGNIQLKLPIKPLAFTGWGWATNFVTTPFVYSGIGTPLGGSGGSGIVTHEGEGINFDVAKLWGGEFSVGAAVIQRQGAGPIYSGTYFNPFISWRRGF